MKKSTVIKKLIAKFPDIHGIKDGESWGSPGSIHLGDAAEGGEINGLAAADYYNEFRSSVYEHEYGFNIHVELASFLDEHGYFCEWYDAGTLLAYEK